MTRHVLVIEDNRDIAHLIQLHLKDLDCEVKLAHDGAKGYNLAKNNLFDLIILDLMLPSLDGLEICKRLRHQAHYTPILMLTSKSSEIDRVLGLEIGADDYLTKPFSLMELLARVKALFRRAEAMSSSPGDAQTTTEFSVNGLTINTEKRHALLNNVPLDLTAKEFDLLTFFARNPGRVYTRAQLLDQVWGHGYEGYEHTVNSHINRLRAKLERDANNPQFILTVWGVGYKFAEFNNSKVKETC